MNSENNIKRIKIGVIGGTRAYDKAMVRIKLLGIEEYVDLILIDKDKCKDKGLHVNQFWIDECRG
ncbi:MAG: hypothetical protein ACOC2U_03625 [bacterium]